MQLKEILADIRQGLAEGRWESKWRSDPMGGKISNPVDPRASEHVDLRAERIAERYDHPKD